MAWGVDRDTLEAGRTEMAELVAAADDPSHYPLEQAARAHRWLGEYAPARRRFREAAADLERRIEARGRGDAWSRGRTGGLLWMAGDHDVARVWFERALGSLGSDSPTDLAKQAAIRYLLGDPVGALDAARRAWERARQRDESDTWPWLEAISALARARADHAPDAARQAREILVTMIRANRMAPHEESGSSDLCTYDWLEESFRAEAELRAEPPPDPATILAQTGLATGKGPRRRTRARPDWPPPPGRHAIRSQTSDGADVEAVIVVGQDGDIELTVDPRPGIALRVLLTLQFGEFLVRVEWGDGVDGFVEETLPDTQAGFRAACQQAADWLTAYAPDPPGRAVAARTVLALADSAFAEA